MYNLISSTNKELHAVMITNNYLIRETAKPIKKEDTWNEHMLGCN